MDVFDNFYKDKNVLITGHTGFKGSWMALWLSELGANVSGYSLVPPTNPSHFDIIQLNNKINHFIGDINDTERLNNVFSKVKPEIVLHLAAQSLVRPSYSDPVLTYRTNIMGLVNLFEAVKNIGTVKAVISVTSDKCYENKEWVYTYRENDPMGGYDPYSSSKGCCELITSAYRNSYLNKMGIECASVRAGNIIGGGDWAVDRLIPDCIRALIDNKDIIIRSPDSVRPWQHVLEPVYGYLLLASKMYIEKVKYSEAWNFGPNITDTLMVKEVVTRILKIWGKGNVVIQQEDKLHEAKMLKLDINKSMHYLNWKPVLTVNECIDFTIEWYKNHYFGKNKIPDYEFSISQIKRFSDKIKNSF